jgi:hypothetical protein
MISLSEGERLLFVGTIMDSRDRGGASIPTFAGGGRICDSVDFPRTKPMLHPATSLIAGEKLSNDTIGT